MRAFKGTLLAAALLSIVAVAVYLFEPRTTELQDIESPKLFRFEKQEMVRVEIHRADGDLVLAEQDDGSWMVEGPMWPANKSMVNRVKHQIHDLNARATVVEQPRAPELYGLGRNAIQVHLTMRDGSRISFLAGDPNPSNVSYYIQPMPGELIYTVKKSAMDYYSMEPEAFRERKFARFDSNDADFIESSMPGNHHLVLQRGSADEWNIVEPIQHRASREQVRRLLGRVTALKARDFVEDHPADLAMYGLDHPRASITIKFGSRDPLVLLIGDPAPPDAETLAQTRTFSYMSVEGDFTIYTARDDLMEDFSVDPQDLRLKKFMRMRVGDVTDVVVDLRESQRSDLNGTVAMMYRADKWLWEDGKPVPGSTPSRVANRAAEIRADAIIAEEASNPARWGFHRPLLTVLLTDRNGTTRTLIVGDETEPLVDDDGREMPRYFAMASDDPTVYRISDGIVDVAEDAVREHRRKANRDEEKQERHSRMEEALGSLPVREDPPAAGKE